MNPERHPTFIFLQRRLWIWEIFLTVATLGIFWFISYMKGFELGSASVIAIGILTMCIVYPRGGFYVIILLIFLESYIGVINQVVTIAGIFEIIGFYPVMQAAYFYILFPAVVFTLILGYLISRRLSNPAPFGMLTTEYIMLVPPLLCLTFAPMSFVMEHPTLSIIADCMLGLFFIAGIIVARVFYPIKGMFYILLNYACIANHAIGFGFLIYTLRTGLLTQNPLFVVWSGRYLMGQTDFNMFLVPILFCVIIWRGPELPRGWRIFYGFSFWAFFLRLIFSLFRGPIAATIFAFIIIYFLANAVQRLEIRRYAVRMLAAVILVILFILVIIPNGGMILDYLFVQRFTGIFAQDTSEGNLSLEIRAVENVKVWEEISEFPIFGYGPGAEIDFRFAANGNTETRSFIHNGYLWLWHKFGILGPISMVLFLLTPFFRGLQLRRKKLTPDESAFLTGAMATTISIFPAIVTNSIIARPQGLLMLILCFTFLLTIERRTLRDEGMDISPYL